jgi:hypothetical protein
MTDWILENLRLVIFLGVILVWIMRSVAGKKSESASPPGSGSAEDPAEAERTRQIQEEIRRRILARQRGEDAAPVTVPPPLPPATSAQRQHYDEDLDDPNYAGEGPNVPMATAAGHRQADAARSAILEQQRLLADQLHALRLARAAGGSIAPASPLKLSDQAKARIASHERGCRKELIRDLQSPTSLRRAILLREILGPPVALARGSEIPRR